MLFHALKAHANLVVDGNIRTVPYSVRAVFVLVLSLFGFGRNVPCQRD